MQLLDWRPTSLSKSYSRSLRCSYQKKKSIYVVFKQSKTYSCRFLLINLTYPGYDRQGINCLKFVPRLSYKLCMPMSFLIWHVDK